MSITSGVCFRDTQERRTDLQDLVRLVCEKDTILNALELHDLLWNMHHYFDSKDPRIRQPARRVWDALLSYEIIQNDSKHPCTGRAMAAEMGLFDD